MAFSNRIVKLGILFSKFVKINVPTFTKIFGEISITNLMNGLVVVCLFYQMINNILWNKYVCFSTELIRKRRKVFNFFFSFQHWWVYFCLHCSLIFSLQISHIIEHTFSTVYHTFRIRFRLSIDNFTKLCGQIARYVTPLHCHFQT